MKKVKVKRGVRVLYKGIPFEAYIDSKVYQVGRGGELRRVKNLQLKNQVIREFNKKFDEEDT